MFFQKFASAPPPRGIYKERILTVVIVVAVTVYSYRINSYSYLITILYLYYCVRFSVFHHSVFGMRESAFRTSVRRFPRLQIRFLSVPSAVLVKAKCRINKARPSPLGKVDCEARRMRFRYLVPGNLIRHCVTPSPKGKGQSHRILIQYPRFRYATLYTREAFLHFRDVETTGPY